MIILIEFLISVSYRNTENDLTLAHFICQGSGCIGRGFKGSFRGRNIHPGKYVHMNSHADQFSIRVKRNGVIHTQVRD
jgi:hypothetical protein